ncbi:MAG TPA: hypothetical protein VF701_02890 [Thermoanaerobaculia bacterium]
MNEYDSTISVGAGASYQAIERNVSGCSPRHAVIVVHGMGQQTPFETVSSLSERVRSVDPRGGEGAVARSVQIGDQRLSRIELTLQGDEAPQEVHFYEAYWAPLTEGRVTLRDVTRFLVTAGLGGLRASLRDTFPRWAFGKMERYPIKRGTWLFLLLTLVVLLSLVVMNGVVLTLGGSSLVTPSRVSPAELTRVNAVAGALAVLMLSFFSTLNSAARSRDGVAVPRFRLLFSLAGWAHALLLAFGVILGAFAMLIAALRPAADSVVLDRLAAHSDGMLTLAIGTVVAIVLSYGLRRNGPLVIHTYVTIAWSVIVTLLIAAVVAGRTLRLGTIEPLSGTLWGWGFLLGATLIVRQVLVQYVGDVAAYVTPQSLDRFSDLRESIKECVQKVGRAVYRAGRDGVLEYEQITVVGHSLGSVAAYDMLNGLMRDDAAGVTQVEVEARTRALVTFGSPLDKIAFLFGTRHANDAAHALAATVQPMIQAGRRGFEWINVYSRHDVVSGELRYFDDHGFPPSVTPVDNRKDATATTPLVAHVEYWNGSELAKCLHSLATSVRSGLSLSFPASVPMSPGLKEAEVVTNEGTKTQLDPPMSFPPRKRPPSIALLSGGILLMALSLAGMWALDEHLKQFKEQDDAGTTASASPSVQSSEGESSQRSAVTLNATGGMPSLLPAGFKAKARHYVLEERESTARKFLVRFFQHVLPAMFVLGVLMILSAFLLYEPIREWIRERFDAITESIAGRLEGAGAMTTERARQAAQILGLGGVIAAGAAVSIAAFEVRIVPDKISVRGVAEAGEVPIVFDQRNPVVIEHDGLRFRLKQPEENEIAFRVADGAGVEGGAQNVTFKFERVDLPAASAPDMQPIADAIGRYAEAVGRHRDELQVMRNSITTLTSSVETRASTEAVNELKARVEGQAVAADQFNTTVRRLADVESKRLLVEAERKAGTDVEGIQLARALFLQNERTWNALFRRGVLDQNCETFRQLAGEFGFLDPSACKPRSRAETLLFWKRKPATSPFKQVTGAPLLPFVQQAAVEDDMPSGTTDSFVRSVSGSGKER